MKKIDKTKSNINVSKLDNKTRKVLFDKFIEAGGNVIKNEKSTKFTSFDREKQKKFKSEIEEQGKNKKVPSPQEPAIIIENVPQKREASGRVRLFFERIIIKLRLYFMNVTDIYGYNLSLSFLEKFHVEYKTALMGLQMLYIDLFKQNYKISKNIVKTLDELKPLYYELIEMTAELFDRTLMHQIFDHYNQYPETPCRVLEIKDPLMALFKKLYILKPYNDLIFFAFDKSIKLQSNMDKKKSSSYSAKRKKLKNDVYIIFNKLFPKLYWLLCLFEGRIISFQYKEIDEFFLISKQELPGKRKKPKVSKMVEFPYVENIVMEEEVDKKAQIPNEIQMGLELMNKVDLKKKRELYDTTNLFKYIKENNKILTLYILLKEFDEEFSFILTTNKIHYSIIITESGKLDYKTKLSEQYNQLKKCYDGLKEYTNIIAYYEKVQQEKPINNTQYIEYSNKLTALNKQQLDIGKNTRMMIKAFMEKLNAELKIIIDDMEGPQKIILNPQDSIIFDQAIEGKKNLNGKKIYEAINIIYYYTLALIFRLSYDGDLSGDLEFSDDEQSIFQNLNATNNERDKKNKKKSSLVKELDDFI